LNSVKKEAGFSLQQQTTELQKQLKGEEPMPTDNVARKRGKAKGKISEKRKAAMERIIVCSFIPQLYHGQQGGSLLSPPPSRVGNSRGIR
jgi:hypothetical protein